MCGLRVPTPGQWLHLLACTSHRQLWESRNQRLCNLGLAKLQLQEPGREGHCHAMYPQCHQWGGVHGPAEYQRELTEMHWE
jgi:hypothetical protein